MPRRGSPSACRRTWNVCCGTGILIEDLEIQGDGPVTINVACLVDGQSREIRADGESAIDAMSNVIRMAAELRLTAAFWQMVGPG